MLYPLDYFQLQLDFAERIVQLTGKKLDDVLLKYTVFYKYAGIPGWDFDPHHPSWQVFLKEFKASENKIQTVYNSYLQGQPSEEQDKSFGCFSYKFDKEENYIQIHFNNNDQDGVSPLSKDKIDIRKNELKMMFQEIRTKYPEVKTVSGFSWIHNLEAYKRLFPPEYEASPKVVTTWFHSAALWGQFVKSDLSMRLDMVTQFKICIKEKITPEELLSCFPYKVLEPEANIETFYKFYEIN